jgi:hypothetical protein
MGQSPLFESLGLDLVAKDLNILESKELTKRVRKYMINQGSVEPTEEEAEEMGLNEPQQPDPQEVAITDNILIQTEKTKSDIEAQDAKTEQGYMKLKQEQDKQNEDFALKLTELEQAMGAQLDAEVASNRLVFDPQTGDFA